MEGTVGLDHEAGLLAEEVDHEWPERLLTTELGAVQPSIPQQSPQLPFRRSCRPAQGAGANGRGAKQARHVPRYRSEPAASCLSADTQQHGRTRQLDEAEEVGRVPLVPGHDPPEAKDPGEEPLDEPAASVPS